MDINFAYKYNLKLIFFSVSVKVVAKLTILNLALYFHFMDNLSTNI